MWGGRCGKYINVMINEWCGRHKGEEGVGYINMGMEGVGDT